MNSALIYLKGTNAFYDDFLPAFWITSVIMTKINSKWLEWYEIFFRKPEL